MLKSTNVCRRFPNVSNLLETEVYERRRARKGLSQQKLSEAMEMSRNCIQQMECHEHLPLMGTLFKLTGPWSSMVRNTKTSWYGCGMPMRRTCVINKNLRKTRDET